MAEVVKSLHFGASKDTTQDEPQESPRRYKMEDRSPGDTPMELSHREESPRKYQNEYQSENEISSSSRESRRRTVRHLLSRMSSLPGKDVLRIAQDIGSLFR